MCALFSRILHVFLITWTSCESSVASFAVRPFCILVFFHKSDGPIQMKMPIGPCFTMSLISFLSVCFFGHGSFSGYLDSGFSLCPLIPIFIPAGSSASLPHCPGPRCHLATFLLYGSVSSGFCQWFFFLLFLTQITHKVG